MIRILVIDNYDSFTYNLVQYFMELGTEVEVVRNDAEPLDRIVQRSIEGVVVSPGPGRPEDSGVSLESVKAFGERRIPLLGVCLGHQCIGTVFGGSVAKAARIMHGKTSPIHHDGVGLFRELPNPFQAMRYHSLIIEEVPPGFEITARTDQEEIMGIRHEKWPLEGVQFHPESYRTDTGIKILENFLENSWKTH